jgi:hypothetical protein
MKNEMKNNFREIIFKINCDNIQMLIDEIKNLFIENDIHFQNMKTWFNLPCNSIRNTSNPHSIKNPFIPPYYNNLQGIVQFLGFSRIDGLPIFFIYVPKNNINQNQTLANDETVSLAFGSKLDCHNVIDSKYQIGNLTNLRIELLFNFYGDDLYENIIFTNRSDRIDKILLTL